MKFYCDYLVDVGFEKSSPKCTHINHPDNKVTNNKTNKTEKYDDGRHFILPLSINMISVVAPNGMYSTWKHSQSEVSFPLHFSGMFNSLHGKSAGISSGCVKTGEGGYVNVKLLIVYILDRRSLNSPETERKYIIN